MDRKGIITMIKANLFQDAVFELNEGHVSRTGDFVNFNEFNCTQLCYLAKNFLCSEVHYDMHDFFIQDCDFTGTIINFLKSHHKNSCEEKKSTIYDFGLVIINKIFSQLQKYYESELDNLYVDHNGELQNGN